MHVYSRIAFTSVAIFCVSKWSRRTLPIPHCPSRQVALSFPQTLWKYKMTLSPPTKVASVFHVSRQITIAPEPQLMELWWDSLTRPPFGVTSEGRYNLSRCIRIIIILSYIHTYTVFNYILVLCIIQFRQIQGVPNWIQICQQKKTNL